MLNVFAFFIWKEFVVRSFLEKGNKANQANIEAKKYVILNIESFQIGPISHQLPFPEGQESWPKKGPIFVSCEWNTALIIRRWFWWTAWIQFWYVYMCKFILMSHEQKFFYDRVKQI